MNFLAQIDQLKDVAQGSEYTLVGVLLVLIGVACWLIYTSSVKILNWLCVRIDLVIERGIKHLEMVDGTMESLKTAISSIHPRLDLIESKVHDVSERLETINTLLREHKCPRDT